MKDPFDRTKVVMRHLPPAFAQSALLDQIDSRFSALYNWISFLPCKNSQKHHRYSRAYIDFKRPEDVVEFAEFFDGHVFVNEKGAQFKTRVEYAPSQRVPKLWSKSDIREGTIFKDPDYLKFLEFLAKPVENLPSAEIQLEKREAERIGSARETPIITPLMDFIRQKRAAKGCSQRPSSNGKLSRKAVGACNSRSASTKRGLGKRRASTSTVYLFLPNTCLPEKLDKLLDLDVNASLLPEYVLRDSAKNARTKEKSTYILVPGRIDQQISDRSAYVAATSATETVEDGSGSSLAVDSGKKKILLRKGKEREISQVSWCVPEQQSVSSPVRNTGSSTSFKQNQRREASGRMIRSIISNKEAHQSQSIGILSEQQSQSLNLEKGKQPPRSTNMRSVLKNHLSSVSQVASSMDCDSRKPLEDKVIGRDLHAFGSVSSEKQGKHTRNKDRPDCSVWSLHRSDGSHAHEESLSSSPTSAAQFSDSLECMTITENVHDHMQGQVKSLGSGHRSLSSLENGTLRHVGRRGPTEGVKDHGGSPNLSEGKPSKRGGATGYGPHERQVWVQKAGSGS